MTKRASLLLQRPSDVCKLTTEANNDLLSRKLFLPFAHLIEKLLQSRGSIIGDFYANALKQLLKLSESESFLRSNFFKHDFLLSELAHNISKQVCSVRFYLKVLYEATELNRLILLVALKREVLFKQIDVSGVT